MSRPTRHKKRIGCYEVGEAPDAVQDEFDYFVGIRGREHEGGIAEMKPVRKIFAARLLALVCDADAQNYSLLARAARRLPKCIIRRLAVVAGD